MWTFLGKIFGDYQCQGCCEEQHRRKVERHEQALKELRLRHTEGRCIYHIPAHTLPPNTTDAEAQRVCDEGLCCCWERRGDKVICWAEM